MRLVGFLAMAVLVAACSSGAPPGATTQAGATTAAGQAAATATPATARPVAATPVAATPAAGTPAAAGGGASLLDKVKAVKHMCDLLPTDLVKAIVPDGTAPQEEQFPTRCSVYGSKTAMEIELDPFNTLGDTPAGADTISGLGTGAYLEHLTTGNFYLSVGLTADGGVLHAEVDIQDGKDHKDEVVNLAKAVMEKLGG